MDLLIDHLNTLNDLTPKLRCEGRNGVDPALIFGLDSKLFLTQESADVNHHDEVETVTLSTRPVHTHAHSANGDGCSCADHEHNGEEQHPSHGPTEEQGGKALSRIALEAALSRLSKETVWRVKGFVRVDGGDYILNWAFGRYDLTPYLPRDGASGGAVKLTIMGERGAVKSAARKFAEAVHATLY